MGKCVKCKQQLKKIKVLIDPGKVQPMGQCTNYGCPRFGLVSATYLEKNKEH